MFLPLRIWLCTLEDLSAILLQHWLQITVSAYEHVHLWWATAVRPLIQRGIMTLEIALVPDLIGTSLHPCCRSNRAVIILCLACVNHTCKSGLNLQLAYHRVPTLVGGPCWFFPPTGLTSRPDRQPGKSHGATASKVRNQNGNTQNTFTIQAHRLPGLSRESCNNYFLPS